MNYVMYERESMKAVMRWSISSFPSFCGGSIAHEFTMYFTKEDLPRVSEFFRNWLLAKKEPTKGDYLIKAAEEYGFGSSDLEVYSPQVAKFVFAAVVEDSVSPSLYWLLSSVPGYGQGEVSINPNSGNRVCLFELTKHYTKKEAYELA